MKPRIWSQKRNIIADRNVSHTFKNMSKAIKFRIKKIVLQYLEDENVQVGVFGSRTKAQTRTGADIDIGIIPQNGWNSSKLTLLREYLENSTIPWKVDLVDFSTVSRDFKSHAMKNWEPWKQ